MPWLFFVALIIFCSSFALASIILLWISPHLHVQNIIIVYYDNRVGIEVGRWLIFILCGISFEVVLVDLSNRLYVYIWAHGITFAQVQLLLKMYWQTEGILLLRAKLIVISGIMVIGFDWARIGFFFDLVIVIAIFIAIVLLILRALHLESNTRRHTESIIFQYLLDDLFFRKDDKTIWIAFKSVEHSRLLLSHSHCLEVRSLETFRFVVKNHLIVVYFVDEVGGFAYLLIYVN